MRHTPKDYDDATQEAGRLAEPLRSHMLEVLAHHMRDEQSQEEDDRIIARRWGRRLETPGLTLANPATGVRMTLYLVRDTPGYTWLWQACAGGNTKRYALAADLDAVARSLARGSIEIAPDPFADLMRGCGDQE